MDIFYNKIKEISNKNSKVAMFIDMDGTLVEYSVYTDEEFKNLEGHFENAEPLQIIIDKIEKINKLGNVDIYILTLSKDNQIVREKKEWLKKHMNFIDEKNWIIINKEAGDYNKENRNIIKTQKMIEKKKNYDHLIFLDDDHKILKTAKEQLKDDINVFHVSSAII